MDLKEAMAVNVRRARREQKLSQEELAGRAGLSSRYLGSIERAAVSASVTVLGQIARALGVDACDLIRIPRRNR
jgi:transcriptional regulator with XRE-family HTH domain